MKCVKNKNLLISLFSTLFANQPPPPRKQPEKTPHTQITVHSLTIKRFLWAMLPDWSYEICHSFADFVRIDG